jgi:hypothetical protein
VNIRTIHITFLLSLLIHALALWQWMPRIRLPSDMSERLAGPTPLTLSLEPSRPVAPAAPARPPQPQARAAPPVMATPAPPKRAPRAPVAQPERRAPVMTQPATPAEPPPYTVPEPAPAPAPPPVARAAPEGDFASSVEARRRARQQQDPVPSPSAPARGEESDSARANRIIAGNLGLGRKPSYGEDTTGGGIFQMQRMTYDYAEYLFYGWSKDIQRNTTQLIAVRRGTHADIRRAVIRSMIGIIRDHEQGDFLWESRRLGRNVMLSARPADDAGLESFLMREFFDDARQAPLSRAP